VPPPPARPSVAPPVPPSPPSPPPAADPSADATVNQRRLRIRFWDEQEEDGDRIQILLNGQPLPGLENVRLTNRGTVAQLELQPGKNVITVVALDKGSKGPCTSGIAILDGVVIRGQAQSRTDDLEVGQSSSLEISVAQGAP
jgi:hypothetical protein